MIRICYAKISSPASDNRLILENTISESIGKVFIGDFGGGIATLSEGIAGKIFQYALYSDAGCGNINLVRNGKIEHTLYGVKCVTSENGDVDKSTSAFCSLREGQILIIECKKNFTRKPIRLDELSFE